MCMPGDAKDCDLPLSPRYQPPRQPRFGPVVVRSPQRRPSGSSSDSVADAASSRWASSIPRASLRPAAFLTNAVAAARSKVGGPPAGPAGTGSKCPRAPNGIDAGASVAVAQAVAHPATSARVRASCATRVLPTPASPERTKPAGGGRDNRSEMSRSSSSRPTSGQRSGARSLIAEPYGPAIESLPALANHPGLGAPSDPRSSRASRQPWIATAPTISRDTIPRRASSVWHIRTQPSSAVGC
jgi:hypothetical protein